LVTQAKASVETPGLAVQPTKLNTNMDLWWGLYTETMGSVQYSMKEAVQAIKDLW